MSDFGTNFEPQLAVKKKEKIPALEAPGLVWFLIILLLVLLGLAVSVFGDYGNLSGPIPSSSEEPVPLETRQPRIYTVSYKNGVFSPTNLRIHSGDTVRFKNEGFMGIRISSDPHPEHNNLVGFDSVGDIPAGSYFTFTFAAKGIFGYHNEGGLKEAGTIIVR